MRLSRIHHDRPIKPLDEAVFWIEFVMHNKGAKHLRVEAHNLTWYQYHCLDVITFLITILTVVLYAFFKMCKFFIMRCCFRLKNAFNILYDALIFYLHWKIRMMLCQCTINPWYSCSKMSQFMFISQSTFANILTFVIYCKVHFMHWNTK